VRPCDNLPHDGPKLPKKATQQHQGDTQGARGKPEDGALRELSAAFALHHNS